MLPYGPMIRCVHIALFTLLLWAGRAASPSALEAVPQQGVRTAGSTPAHVEAGDPAPGGGRGRYRVGVTLGGTNLAGLTFEVRRGGWAAEATLGSFTLRDVALSVAGKRYFSGRTFQPFLGFGLWGIGASTDEGRGAALIARIPAGLDWRFVGEHSIGTELSLNRAIAVRRMDPEDEDPPSTALIPIPSFYYRYGW